ncbi:hypothetical protein SCALM49S_03936 [Streptomyces californicus]
MRVAARDLEEHPRTLGSWTGGYESLIRDALKDSGEGPSAGGVLHVDKRTATSATPADKAGDSVERFEVSAKDVDAAFCLSVSPPEPEPGLTSVTVSLSVSVEEGGCSAAGPGPAGNAADRCGRRLEVAAAAAPTVMTRAGETGPVKRW